VSASVCETLVDRIKELPALPAVTRQIVSLMDDPETDAAGLAQAIARDQALSAKLLKIANSSLYGFQGRIDTLGRAVILLGPSAVESLALSVSISPLLTHTGSGGPFEPYELWKHSLGVGFATRRLLSGDDPHSAHDADRGMLAGVLHDVGLSLEARHCPHPFREAVERFAAQGGRLLDHERACIGSDHVELATALVTRWGFPDSIRAAIAHHHDTVEQLRAAGSRLPIAVAAAERMAAGLAVGQPDLSPDADGVADLLTLLGYPPDTAGPIIGAASREVADCCHLLD